MNTRHVYRIFVRATAEQVWTALIDPAFTRQYFHGTAFDESPQAGQPYRTAMPDGRPAIDGVIEVCEPPRRLVQTWHVLYDTAMSEEPPSRVEWTITDAGEGMVRVDLVHGDLARSPLTWSRVKDGWVWILDSLKSLLETGAALPEESQNTSSPTDDAAGEWHRAQGIECNNRCWTMIEAERTADNDEELLRCAYSAAYHWQRAVRREPVNEVRARYMLAKAHLVAGHGPIALQYADMTLSLATGLGLVDFDLAYAHEVRARALKAVGRLAEADQEWSAALEVSIADPEDKAIVDADFAVPL
jgi:uncharacterized protein YndB with AHSA1/START domain